MEDEVWKPVVGYEGLYEVSNLGRVRSLDRRVPSRWGATRVMPGKLLSPKASDEGYVGILLYPVVPSGKPRKFVRKLIHRLVAESFIRIPEDGEEVNHKDFNRSNNRVENLEWVSSSDNVQHSVKAGRWASAHNSATNPNKWKKLSLEQARAAILAVDLGETRYRVAKNLGVTFNTITNLCNNRDRYFNIT